MKKIIFILLLAPLFSLGQEKLSLKNVLNISDKDSFLKEVIENGYSEGNSTKDKIYYGKGMSKDKTLATDWAEYTLTNGEFYFEQGDLTSARKRAKDGACYYDLIVSDIKNQCQHVKVMVHDSKKNGEVNFSTYQCSGAKFKGNIGFAQIDGNGVIQEFPAH
ncbi:MAG: hypothetical protein P8L23_06335 [Flavobacteriales bacterium]|nr:hypothetical protein [Flavobacteriales bacterium]